MSIPHTVVELPTFARQAGAFLSDEERHAIIDTVAADPTVGDVIQGTSGARKLRVPAQQRGKSGGARVIYYFGDLRFPVYLFAIYPKSKASDLSADQRRALATLVDQLKNAMRGAR